MDLTLVAIPFYFGSMGAEYAVLRKRGEREGAAAADYELRDTITSLSMGVGSLVAPIVLGKILEPVAPKGKARKVLIGAAAGAAAITTLADLAVRLEPDDPTPPVPGTEVPSRRLRRRIARAGRRVRGSTAAAAIAAGGTALTTGWAARTTAKRLWKRRVGPDLGTGIAATVAAVFAWDFIYYWNHRLMHESRFMWAIHVVHHSSERYNLSTALRQPVAEEFGTFIPTGALSLLGIRPDLVETARGVNLLYQYWIHTETIKRLGPLEKLFNTPSHHRVHHGSNSQYLDRNHGSILIIWDRLFGTFEPEGAPVVYGLTKNIKTFNPLRVATHEHADILSDVKHSSTWRERLSYVVRGPGWAYSQHAARLAATDDADRSGAFADDHASAESPAMSKALV